MATFFLGIFYLQYKINELLDWLISDVGDEGETNARVSSVLPSPPMNS